MLEFNISIWFTTNTRTQIQSVILYSKTRSKRSISDKNKWINIRFDWPDSINTYLENQEMDGLIENLIDR